MATPAQFVEQKALADQEDARNRRNALQDEQRKVTLKTLLEDADTPQDKVAAIQAVYHQDPGVLRQHVDNLTRRITGKQPQPVVTPEQAQQERIASIAAQGKTPAQQTLENSAAALKWIRSLPQDEQQQAAQILGIRFAPKWVNVRNPQTGETMAVDESQGIPPGWVLAGTSSGNVRSLGYGITPKDAIQTMRTTGQPLAKPGGGVYSEAELAALPPNSQLRAFAVGGEVYYGVADQSQHTVTFGNQVYRMDQFGNVDTSAPLGVARVPTAHSSTTTDPFGVTSTTQSTTTPVTPSIHSVSTTGTVAPQPQRSPAPRKGTQVRARTQNPKSGELDATGHIPISAGNPQLVQAANSLIDGMDVDKLPIPQRDRTAAMKLASEYGWAGQGTFTPQQKVLINEAGAKLNQLAKSPSLSVLDDAKSRAKIAAVLHASSGSSGLMGILVGSQLAGQLTPKEQEFIRAYNAAVGVISGLGPITRGNRATEAAVQRLMVELPSVLQSGSSADAKKRVQQLLQEIDLAQQTNGTTPLGASPAPKDSGKSLADRLNEALQ